MTQDAGAAPGVAVITGGASGFGLALAHRCAARGYAVALLDRDGARAKAEAAELAHTLHVNTLGMTADVTKGDSLAAAAQAVDNHFGRADLVFSNVGVQLFGPVERLTDDEWSWVLDVNVTGSARVARAFLPLLRQAPRGRLVFTSSSSVLDPGSRMAAYQASKFAVWGLAETLRLELANDKIGIAVIFPSGMISRHLDTSREAQPESISRPVGDDSDFEAMFASNPGLAQAVLSPDDAARHVLDAVLADEPYIITHGDLRHATATRASQFQRAAEAVINS